MRHDAGLTCGTAKIYSRLSRICVRVNAMAIDMDTTSATAIDVAQDKSANSAESARLAAALGQDTAALTLKDKLRRALRAARFEETPPTVWRKVLPTMPEGVGTMRANDLFCWARSHMVEAELGKGSSVTGAYRAAARRLLASACSTSASLRRSNRSTSRMGSAARLPPCLIAKRRGSRLM